MQLVDVPKGKFIQHKKIKIYPSKEQAMFIDRCIDIHRYVFNWALEQQEKQLEKYRNHETDHSILSKSELERSFTKLRNDPNYYFLKNIPHITERLAIWELDKAYSRYFKRNANHPKYKSKKIQETFYYKTRADRAYFKGSRIRIEGLKFGDSIDIKYDTGFTKKSSPHLYDVTISKDFDNSYWLSFGYMEDIKYDYFELSNIPKMNKAIGIDLNVKKRFQLSTGDVFIAPDISKLEKRLKRIQRKNNKDRKRYQERTNLDYDKDRLSKRAKKRLLKQGKIKRKISNIEHTFIHQSTMAIIKMNPSAIVIEDLKVNDMMTKHWVAKKVYYCNFRYCREILEYKCMKYNIPLIIAPKTYPSSQLCSNCGHIRKIGGNKIYKCPHCGLNIDRDLNAALNLEKLAYTIDYSDILNELIVA